MPSAIEETEVVEVVEILVGATYKLDADAEEVASDTLAEESMALAITAEELPSSLEDTEDVEVFDVIAGAMFKLDTDVEEEASGVLLGEATIPGVPADIMLDCPC
jgi:hypothetical protein